MQSNVFICPRLKEGIGMANVEAISLGKYLISNNDATMSEYIINDKIGIFYNNWKRKKLNIQNVIKFNSYRYSYALKGYKTFQKNRIKIINFVQREKYKDYNLNYYFFLLFIFRLYSLKENYLSS